MRPLSVVLLSLAVCAPLASTASAQGSPADADAVGVLVMAHGGTPEWDRAIADAVAPLSGALPTVTAFGMADHGTLSAAIDSLRNLGVRRVALVRLFVSGASFLDQTRYFVGLSDVAPRVFVGHAGHGGAAVTTPIEHDLAIATHEDGLMGSAEAREIIEARVHELSSDPSAESVLLIAHGMGVEAENDAVVAAMREVAAVLVDRGIARVEVRTLREDWPAARALEEPAIRAFVESESTAGRRVLVVPYRLNGFGPYATVLDGLRYSAADALLPHASVTKWIERTAGGIACAQGWANPLGDC